jgi:hypothetical protein
MPPPRYLRPSRARAAVAASDGAGFNVAPGVAPAALRPLSIRVPPTNLLVFLVKLASPAGFEPTAPGLGIQWNMRDFNWLAWSEGDRRNYMEQWVMGRVIDVRSQFHLVL